MPQPSAAYGSAGDWRSAGGVFGETVQRCRPANPLAALRRHPEALSRIEASLGRADFNAWGASALTAFAGVGLGTAEMLMIFSYGRPDVLSIGDFGVRHGVRVVYGREMTTKELRELKTRVSPWGSVASIIFWAAASGRFDLRRPDRSESAEG